VLARIRELGIGIAIDDYGTGYSALSYLTHLSVDSLKIDRSFVSNLRQDAKNAAIVRSTIALAENLGLTVVAEGIETPDQLELLREFGCHQAQGFGLAKPMPADEMLAWHIAHELASDVHGLGAHVAGGMAAGTPVPVFIEPDPRRPPSRR